MKRLILMHHAATGLGYNPAPHSPLTPAGTRTATAAGQFLAGYAIDLALVAPTTYAIQTWELACLGGARAARVELTHWLADTLGHQLTPLVLGLPEEASTVLLLGREPALTKVVFGLLKPLQSVFEDLPNGSFFIMTHEGQWYNMAGAAKTELYKYIKTPRK